MLSAEAEKARVAVVNQYLDVQREAISDLVALCELAALLCGVSSAAVNLIDDRFQHQFKAIGVDAGICAKEDSMCATTVAGGVDILLADASLDERFARNPWVDGRLARVRFYSSTLLVAPGGELVGTLCVFDEQPHQLPETRRDALVKLARQVVDVLELQVRTNQLVDAVAELSRSQEQLAAFAGQVSHDLKTPLTGMLGFSELLLERDSVLGDSAAAGYAQRCLSSSQRMMSMIEDLLHYARLGGTLRRERVDLDELMSQVREDLGARVDGATVRWGAGTLVGDPVQLRALLQNLVGNALIYRREDVPVEVTVGADAVADGVALTVADNGTGIPADKRTDVLSPLARLRADVPGTGLGLATCRRIVSSHGGSMELSDTPGGGLTVTVVLPA